MFIILSQKAESESSYSDTLFRTYHYPAKYRNQVHEGDLFIYHQGNKDKGLRCYFGMGRIGKITIEDSDNYYAELISCVKFQEPVSIYLPNGKYIEQIGYESVRKAPPWQWAVRQLSEDAYNYIINLAGLEKSFPALTAPNIETQEPHIKSLEELLKQAIGDYFLSDDFSAIHRIMQISSQIGEEASEEDMRNVREQERSKASGSPAISSNPAHPIEEVAGEEPDVINLVLTDYKMHGSRQK